MLPQRRHRRFHFLLRASHRRWQPHPLTRQRLLRGVSHDVQSRLTGPLVMLLLATAVAVAGDRAVAAQPSDTPVYTNDSPQAMQLLGRLPELRQAGNVAEAARVVRQLVEEFGPRLIAATSDPETNDPIYRNVRAVVIDLLAADPSLRARYQALAEPLARETLSLATLEQVWLTRPLTPTAFYAGLTLAESDIRRGRITAAETILAEMNAWPPLDPGDRAVDPAGTEVPVEILRRRHEALLRLTQDLRNREHSVPWQIAGDRSPRIPPQDLAGRPATDTPAPQEGAMRGPVDDRRSSGWGVTDAVPAPRLDRMLDAPAWSFSHPLRLGALVDNSRVNRQRREEIRGLRNDGSLVNALPVAQDDLVFVSDSLLIAAVDRFSGDVRWQFSLLETPDPSDVLAMRTDAWDTFTAQPAGIGVYGDHVVAVLRPDRIYRSEAGGSVLVCFDRDSGGIRWIAEPTALDPDLSEGVFVGMPLIHEGSVYLVVRRHALRLATDSLVRLDLATGELVWRRYLVSSGLESRWAVSPPTQPLLVGNDLVYTSPIGASLRIDLDFGLVRWLRLASPAVDVIRVQNLRPWEFDSPVLTEEGVLTFTPDRRALQLLDFETGAQRGYFSRNALGNPKYLVGLPVPVPGPVDTGRHEGAGAAPRTPRTLVIGVGGTEMQGRQIVPMPTGGYSANVVWRLELTDDEAIVGRVQTGADGSLIAGTRSLLRRFEGATGELLDEVAIATPGIPLVIGEEVLLSTADGVVSYLPFEVGAPRLRERIVADPLDPRPAVNLARLAFRHGRFAEVLPAIDQAIAIVNQQSRAARDGREHRRLLDMMLAMIRFGVTEDPAPPAPPLTDPAAASAAVSATQPATEESAARRVKARELGPALLDRIDRLARTPAERVDYQLVRGQYLADIGDHRAAVDAYQQILLDPTLRQQRWRTDRRRMPVRLEVNRRLQALMQEHGPQIYAAYAAAATSQLEELLASPAATPADRGPALVEFASRYPFSEAAVQATLHAGRAMLEAGQTGRAVAAWRLGLEFGAGDPAQRSRVVANLVTELVRLGRHDRAWRELVLATNDNPAAHDNPAAVADEAPASAPETDPAALASAGLPEDAAKVDSPTPQRSLVIAPGDAAPLVELLGLEWERALADLAGVDDRPAAIGAIDPDQPVQRMVADALLMTPAGRGPTQVALVRKGTRVVALGGPSLTAQWDYDAETPLVELAWFGSDEALLWTWVSGRHATLTCLRLRDGAVRWRADVPALATAASERRRGGAPGADSPEATPVAAPLAEAPPTARQPAGRRPEEGVTRGTRPLFAPMVTASEIILIDQWEREVMCLDRGSGDLAWVRAVDLGRFTHAELDPLGIVIAGDDLAVATSTADFGSRMYDGQAQVIALDPISGEPLMRMRLSPGQAVQWVKISDRSEAIIGADGALVCLDLVRLEERWQLQHPDLELPTWPGVAGNVLLVGDADLQLRPVHLSTGMLAPSPDLRAIGRPAATPMTYALTEQGRWIYKTQDDVAIFDRDGRLTGRLNRGEDTGVTVRAVAPAGDRVVIVETQGDGDERMVVLYAIDLSGRRLSWSYDLATQILPRFNAALVIDGWLLLDAGINLVAVPMPLNGPAGTADAGEHAPPGESAIGAGIMSGAGAARAAG